MSTTVQVSSESLHCPLADRSKFPSPKSDDGSLDRIAQVRQAAYQPDRTRSAATDHSHYPKAARLAIIAGGSALFWGAIAAAISLTNS